MLVPAMEADASFDGVRNIDMPKLGKYSRSLVNIQRGLEDQ